MTRAAVTVQRACGGEGVPDDAAVRAFIELALAEAAPAAPRSCEIAVRIVDQDEGAALNRRYRGRDEPTNVLSFPAAGAGELAALDDDEPLPLGDLVLCAPLIAREAGEQGKQPADHWAHLLVHGTLHLLGYDHATALEAREMEGLETRILARGGIGDPWAEREPA